jgi:methyltransferase family protein
MQDLSAIFSSIGIDRDYRTMDFSDIGQDMQGWNSTHPLFEDLLRQVKPTVVVEVGSWKGASIIHMAKIARTLNLTTKFICVDTWLGSNDVLWLEPQYRKSLLLRHGYPSMFRQFILNIMANEVADDIYPLPMTSSSGYHLLKKLGISPERIYIDSGHEEDEIAIDIKLYFDLLAGGGCLLGDDYHHSWIGVVRAVNRFCADKGLPLNVSGEKWHVMKPG